MVKNKAGLVEGIEGRGRLIIIGGHEEHEGERLILREVARHVKNGRLVLATIASHEPEGYLERYRASFADLGVNEVVELYVEDRHEAMLPEKLEALEGVHAVFFSGGDQLRITSQIGDTPIYERIHAIFEAGGLIAGTSAGASAMADTMLVRGQSAASFRIGDARMAPGLGLLPNVIIDQHFAERGRIGRLIGAVSQNPRVLGIGIDEDTAIVVEGHRFRVIGSGAVYLVDASEVTHSNIAEAETDAALSIYDLTLHVLSAGDAFDLVTRRPAPA
ncbi:cyanophycinase [Rubellimicrobium arenae]|uniref:cyanophycinase n=1 Tax=Rubellimicrobium arenae TaxID=2817372 RepID=UPI001B301117|nr:cyanophycinase [Rubellimicrobium arenae]